MKLKTHVILRTCSLQLGEFAGKKRQSINVEVTNLEQPRCYKHNNWKGWGGRWSV